MKIIKICVLISTVILFQLITAAQNKHEKKYSSFENVFYIHNDDSLQSLDAFFPDKKKNSPVIIFFHGGVWIHGDKSSLREIGIRFAEKGIITVIPNYRLSPKVKHPAHVEDAASAVKWVFNNINKLGGDSSKIYLVGHSAGAHLAALLVTDEKYLLNEGIKTSKIDGVIGISGVYLIAPNPNGATEKFIKLIFGNSPDEWRKASPIYNVQSTEKRFPKFLAAWSANEDPLIVEENVNWISELNKFKHKNEHIIIGDMGHTGFIKTLGTENDELTNRIYKFIELK